MQRTTPGERRVSSLPYRADVYHLQPSTNCEKLSERCKHDHATIAKALTGHWRTEHLFALQQAVDQYDFLAQQLRACDGHIEGCLQAFVPDVETNAPPSPPARTWRSSRSNALSFDVQAYLDRITHF